MIFGAQARSNKATLLLVGAVVFLALFVGLAYNHMDYWHAPSTYVESHTPQAVSQPRGASASRCVRS